MKIKFRLSLIVISIIVVVITVLAGVLLSRASQTALGLGVSSAERVAEARANYWQGREEGFLRVARTIATIMGNYENLPVEERRARYNMNMRAVFEGEPSIVLIYTVWKPNSIDRDADHTGTTVYPANGQYATAFNSEGGKIIQENTNQIQVLMNHINGPNARKTLIQDPEVRRIEGKDTEIIRMVAPVINKRTGEVVGAVGVALNAHGVQPVVEETFKSHDDIAAMVIYTDNGTILGSYRPETVGKNLVDANRDLYGDSADNVLASIRSGKVYKTKKYSQTLDTNLYITIYPFTIGDSGQRWSVMVGTAEEYILKPIDAMKLFSIILAVIMIIAVTLVMYVVIHRATKPLVSMSATLGLIAQGDLTQAVNIRSKDEIGDMAQNFNHTIDAIKHLIMTIKHQAANLSDTGAELSSNMTETAAAINQITANISSIKDRVMNQSASVTETSATMEQVTGNIEKLNTHVDRQSAQVTQSSSAIEEMIANIRAVAATLDKNSKSVEQLSDASRIGRSGLGEVAADIQEIAKESEGLLEINAVMQNIASQTNLLSMNAAIEAAHAGEAGKGFAVVADEIRKLAENSAAQSKTIGNVLKRIKTSIDKITASTENVLQKFDAIEKNVTTVSAQTQDINTAMEEQNAGSRQILETVGVLNEITSQVKNGSNEMLEGSQQVIAESKNLESVTQEITNGMNEMASGAAQINVAVTRVNTISGANKEGIDILVNAVSKFKVE